jgi:hypothetical protein
MAMMNNISNEQFVKSSSYLDREFTANELTGKKDNNSRCVNIFLQNTISQTEFVTVQ